MNSGLAVRRQSEAAGQVVPVTGDVLESVPAKGSWVFWARLDNPGDLTDIALSHKKWLAGLTGSPNQPVLAMVPGRSSLAALCLRICRTAPNPPSAMVVQFCSVLGIEDRGEFSATRFVYATDLFCRVREELPATRKGFSPTLHHGIDCLAIRLK